MSDHNTEQAAHVRRESSFLFGRDLIGVLTGQGVCPADTTRVVIDAGINDVVVVYVEQVGTRGLLDVLRAFSRTTTVIHHMRPADEPASTDAHEEKGTER